MSSRSLPNRISPNQYLGPKLMENRRPFQLRKIIIAYNLLQILISWKIFHDGAKHGWFTKGDHAYNWQCQLINRSPSGFPLLVGYQIFVCLPEFRNVRRLQMAETSWLYYISKFTEFFDTFFFVLRKRYDQVSTLHVIHHGIMPFSGKNFSDCTTCSS
jgi:elongation of very long chain fatty acids protein 7